MQKGSVYSPEHIYLTEKISLILLAVNNLISYKVAFYEVGQGDKKSKKRVVKLDE